jgi:hypothetical protein
LLGKSKKLILIIKITNSEGNISTQLENFIRDGRRTGMSDESIRSNLLHVGWAEAQIKEGFKAVDKTTGTYGNNIDFGAYSTENSKSQGPSADFSGSAAGLSGSDMEEKKAPNRKKRLKIAALTMFAFVIIAGGVSSYIFLNPVLTKYLALKDLGNIESGRFQGRLVLKEASGAVDEKQAESDNALKLLLDGYFDGREVKSDFVAKIEVPAGYISPEANVMTFGDKAYFMLSKLPIPETPGQPKLQDTWYFYESEEDKKTPQESQKTENKEQKREISRYLSDIKVFKTFRKMSDEKVGGVDCNQYGFDLDIPKLSDVLIKAFSENGALMTEGEKEKFKKSMNEIKSMNGSMLIGKKDKMIYRLDIYTETKEVTIDITLKMSEINKKHVFKEPEGAKSMKDTFNMKDKTLPIFSPSDTAMSPI